MKKKDDTLAILFVTILTIVIWLWSAGQTKHESVITTELRFRPPEGSTTTVRVRPESEFVTLTLSGPRSAVESAQKACEDGLDITIAAADGEFTLQDLPTKLSLIDAIRNTGAEVISTKPSVFTLDVQTMIRVEAAVEAVLPSVTVSGDVTVDPATVTLHIPKNIRSELPEAITVNAVVSEAALGQVLPGFVHKRDAVVQLPASLEGSEVLVDPNRVSVKFKIQSNTQRTTLQQVRILIAGPAEDYAAYSVSLPRTIVPNVTIVADTDIIDRINSGDVTVFAVVRLASRDMEQKINSKTVTSFLAILEDGSGHQVEVSVEDPALLEIELLIEPLTQQPQ